MSLASEVSNGARAVGPGVTACSVAESQAGVLPAAGPGDADRAGRDRSGRQALADGFSLEWIASAQRLAAQGRAFALVSVVRVEAPTSARPGDKAIVTDDGRIEGWIGGGCAQPAVLRTVRQALADGQARMIRIAPAAPGGGMAALADASSPQGPAARELGDVLEFGMACHSGGTLELFIDPVLPAAHLVVVGDSPVAVSLAELAPRVGMAVTVIAHDAATARFPDARRVLTSDAVEALADLALPGAFVVVATQGRRDLQGLRAALALRARKVFFVASARKADVFRRTLLEGGHEAAAVAAIVAPAGQAIGARTPQEIALAVLAAVVGARRSGTVDALPSTAKPSRAPPLPALAPIVGSCCGGG